MLPVRCYYCYNGTIEEIDIIYINHVSLLMWGCHKTITCLSSISVNIHAAIIISRLASPTSLVYWLAFIRSSMLLVLANCSSQTGAAIHSSLAWGQIRGQLSFLLGYFEGSTFSRPHPCQWARSCHPWEHSAAIWYWVALPPSFSIVRCDCTTNHSLKMDLSLLPSTSTFKL